VKVQTVNGFLQVFDRLQKIYLKLKEFQKLIQTHHFWDLTKETQIHLQFFLSLSQKHFAFFVKIERVLRRKFWNFAVQLKGFDFKLDLFVQLL